MNQQVVPVPSEASQPERAAATCACGNDRDHFMVSCLPQYTGLSWVWVIFGITTVPYEVQFKCRQCGEIFDRSHDEKLMRRYI